MEQHFAKSSNSEDNSYASDAYDLCQENVRIAVQALLQLREGQYKIPSPTVLNVGTYRSDSQLSDIFSESNTDEHIDVMTDSGTDSLPEINYASRKCSETKGSPKKRWLQQWDSAGDLDQPSINDAVDLNNIKEENQKRPTVPILLRNGQTREVPESDLEVAMTLLELHNSKPY